jgi:hypothetical protein
MQRLLVSKKDLKEFGVPYSFSHIARLEAAGRFPKRKPSVKAAWTGRMGLHEVRRS